jgi:hypothetical protein
LKTFNRVVWTGYNQCSSFDQLSMALPASNTDFIFPSMDFFTPAPATIESNITTTPGSFVTMTPTPSVSATNADGLNAIPMVQTGPLTQIDFNLQSTCTTATNSALLPTPAGTQEDVVKFSKGPNVDDGGKAPNSTSAKGAPKKRGRDEVDENNQLPDGVKRVRKVKTRST